MLTLAINTASSLEALALISGTKIIKEVTWKGRCDESEKLLRTIAHLLKAVHTTWDNLGRIAVVNGPGPFSATRIGVTVANTLSFSLGIPLFSVSIETVWMHRLKGKMNDRNTVLLIHAGGNWVARRTPRQGAAKIISIAEAFDEKTKGLAFFGDLTENEERIAKGKRMPFLSEKQLRSFGEALCALPSSLLAKKQYAAPTYWKAPTITQPRNVH